MQTFIKISIVALVALAGYTLFANYGIPQVRPAPPPAEEEAIGAMSMDQFIALGKKYLRERAHARFVITPYSEEGLQT